MIDQAIKEEIRGHIVRANMALHKNKFAELRESLRVAQIISESVGDSAAEGKKALVVKQHKDTQHENLRLF